MKKNNLKDMGAIKRSIPRSISPQLATLVKNPPSGKDWAFEIKYDGYRLLSFIQDNNIKLITRHKHNWSDKFPQIISDLQKIKIGTAIFDGEVVALDKKGISKFQLLQNMMTFGEKTPVVYYVFDILYCNGYDLSSLSLKVRKNILKNVLKISSTSLVQLSEMFKGNAKNLLKKACKKGFEGLMAKNLNSRYEFKRTKTWLKLKCFHEQEFVVAGFTKPAGKRKYFGALLLGYYDAKNQLHYAGKVGTGFDELTLENIYNKMKKLISRKSPFYKKAIIPEERLAIWLKPALVGEVMFAEWTKDNRIRHSAFKGLRLDKKAKEVKKEIPIKK